MAPEIDFSLRADKYDPFKLLPLFYQELDATLGNNGARMLMSAWADQWFELYALTNGIISPGHDSWYAGPNTLPYLANLLNAPDLTAFDPTAQNLMVWTWPAIRAEKGVERSVVAVAALLGFKVNVRTLWSAFALPNPTNLADASNNPYLAYEPAVPIAPGGILNEDAFALRQKNGLWVLAENLLGGESTVRLFNNPAFTQPTPGYTIFFPNRVEVYTVVSSTPTTESTGDGLPVNLAIIEISPPLSTVPGVTVTAGTELPIFDPSIIYPASFYDFEIVVDRDVPDPTEIVDSFASKLKVLTDSVIPIRDRLRRILSTYQAEASYTAYCPTGLYGTPTTAIATYSSAYSYADAEANALLAAEKQAIAALRCEPEPPLVSITGIEPLTYTAFYSTASFTAYCPEGYYGPSNTVTVTRSSTLSQADADALAFAAARGLAEAGLKCTLNSPPIVSFGDITPSYSARATYTAVCPAGAIGRPVTVVGSGLSLTSYASAEAAALAGASTAAGAALVCEAAAAPSIVVEDFIYTITVGVTVTETCPSGTQGIPQTVSQLYTYQSRGEFRPTYDNAITLATAAAARTANAGLRCVSNTGPTILIDPPTQVYSATTTVTETCPSGLNIAPGNVVTATYTGSDPASYANAYAIAGSGAAATATAALDCTPPPFNPDSILLTAKDEFGYDPVLRYDNARRPYNSGNDYYYAGTALGSARSDFTRFLAADAPALKARGITTVVLTVDWFTPFNNMASLAPYMSVNFASRIIPSGSGNATWSVAGYNPATASTLPPNAYRGGTQNDASVKATIVALNSAGFKVGINPVVRFIDNTNGVLADRSTVNFDSAPAGSFTTWLTAYSNFLTNYANLFKTVGVNPSIFYLGNSYRGLTNSPVLANRRLFLQTLLTSAASLAATFPSAIITYAARNDEYSFNSTLGDFPLDGLWNSTNVTLGINWYEPSATLTSTTYNKAILGAASGEDMYLTYPNLAETNRLLNTTDGAGKTNAASVSINPGIGSKNLGSYLSTANYHYTPAPSGYAAGATVLPGNAFTDAFSLGGLTTVGNAFLESRFNWFAPRSYGILPRPSSNALTALVVGGGSYASTLLPAPFTAGAVNNITVELDFKPDYAGSPPTSFFPGLASVPDGGFRIEYNGGYRSIRTSIVMSAGANFVTPGVFADDETITSYHVQWAYSPSGAGSAWMVTEGYYSGGTLVSNTLPLGGTPYLLSTTGKLYLGAAGAGTNTFTGSIYRFKLDAVSNASPSVHYGGTYFFDEAYAGTRTGYLAENVPAILTELGVPSIAGGLVEPVIDPTPVPVNPSSTVFGDSTLVPNSDAGNAGLLIAQLASLAIGGVLRSFSIYLDAVDGKITFGLYDATGPVGNPGNLLTSTPPVTPTTPGWYTLTLAAPIFIPAGNYYLAFLTNSNLMTFRTQTVTGSFSYVGVPFGPLPASFPFTTLGGTGDWSFYGSITVGGPIALPGWLDPAENAYLTGVLATGYSFSDLRGPYGSSFKRDNLSQLLGATANLAAVRAAGINRNLVISEWDVRSPGAFSALSNGAYVYYDGPLYPYRRVLNGKLLLG
jgi:hypothetical protein